MITGIVSGKGGVGKTAVAANLGLELHRMGVKVVVVEINPDTSNLGLYLGVSEYLKSRKGVLAQENDISKTMHVHETGLRFIPASAREDSFEIKMPGKPFFENLRGMGAYYHILVDCPPGIGSDVQEIIKNCDEIIIICEPYLPDATNSLKLIRLARDFGINVRGAVINKAGGKEYELGRPALENFMETEIIGQIPYDEKMLEALASKKLLVDYDSSSKAGKAFLNLASKILGQEFSLEEQKRVRWPFKSAFSDPK